MRKITIITSLMLLFTVSVLSQITLVKDIVTTDGDAWVNNFIEGNNFVIFSYNGQNGSQIWATDGTEAGTVNIAANVTDIFGLQQTNIVFNNELYFIIDNGSVGSEVFKTDGTLAGTKLVKDINPNFGSNPENFTIFNGQLFFTADDGVNGSQLWKTDGTTAGTVLVSATPKFASNLTVFNGNLYFQAQDNNFDSELWKSDGTGAGTLVLKDIDPAGSSSPSDFTVFNGALFFTAYTTNEGVELWKTDGTAAGTVLVKDINPGVTGSQISNLQVNDNFFIFTADDGTNGNEVWKTDGTTAGTTLLKNISAGANSTNFSGMLNFNTSTTFIIAETTDFGREVWKTDGTAAGTLILKDINPGVDSSISQFSSVNPLIYNGTIYFEANDGTNGIELWKSDGTTAGTMLVKDVNSDNSVENGRGLFGGTFLANNKIIFEGFNTDTNRELWITDGTEGGTNILKDLNTDKGWGVSLDESITFNNLLLFNGSNGNNGFELWKTDGTAAGTVMLKNLNDAPDGSNPANFGIALNKLYIKADSTSFGNPRLFATDGTVAGSDWVIDNNNGLIINPTAITEFKGKVYMSSSDFVNDYGIFYSDLQDAKVFVKKINPNGFANITSFFHYQTTDELFFAADDGTNGRELWKTDGTAAGTVLVKDLKTGADGSSISDFFEYNNSLYFMTTESTVGFPRNYRKSLWKTDGTAAGTTLLKQFSFFGTNPTPYFTPYKNKLYFTAYDSSTGGIHLWRTDGTAAGTEAAYVGFDFPKSMIVINNTMFLAASNNVEGQEMWKYDGTDAEIFKSFSAGANGGYYPITTFTKLVNDKFYFMVNDNGNNSLWKTNGTLAGTIKLIENFSFIKELAVAGDVLYFSMDDNLSGTELWKSDGTEAGTIMVQDLFPGEDSFGSKNSSNPSNLTLYGNDLYFSAKSGNYGEELFKLSNAVLSVEKEFVNAQEIKMNVFPNPATTKVTISIKENRQIQKVDFYNIMGQRVIEKKLKDASSLEINTTTLSKGIYFVKVKTNNKSITQKLIIK